MQILRTLMRVQSPSAVFLGKAEPTPRWVRVFWAGYDVVAATVGAAFRAALVAVLLGLILGLIAGV